MGAIWPQIAVVRPGDGSTVVLTYVRKRHRGKYYIKLVMQRAWGNEAEMSAVQRLVEDAYRADKLEKVNLRVVFEDGTRLWEVHAHQGEIS